MRRGWGLSLLLVFTAGVLTPAAKGHTGPPAERVYLIYDSVMNGARDNIRAALPPAGFDPYLNGWGGMRLDQALEQIRLNRAQINRVAVMHLGHNHIGSVAAFAAAVDEAMRLLGDVDTVIWLTTQEYIARQVGINAELYRAALRWPNMLVVDWRPLAVPPNVGSPINIHLSGAGRRALTQLVLDQLAAWRASLTPPLGAWAAMPVSFRGGVHLSTVRVDAVPAEEQVLVGAGSGGGPQVARFDLAGGRRGGFFAYDAAFRGGVRVAGCDLDADGTDEIVTGPGPGGGPHVRTFEPDGRPLGAFFAYAATFTGGIWVACGDLDGDHRAEIVTGADHGGGPHVRIFDGRGRRVRDLFPYNTAFTGGVRVATGDLDGDGDDEVITGAGPGGGPHVRALEVDGRPIGGFLAYSPAFTGGVDVAAGDVGGDGRHEIVTAPGEPGGAHVRVLGPDGRARLGDRMAFDITGSGGRVTVVNRRIVAGLGPRSRPWVRSV